MMLSGRWALPHGSSQLSESVHGTDLRDYYYAAMRPIWWLATLTVIAATLFRPLVFGDTLFSASNATSFAFLAGFIALGASRRPLLHAILVPTRSRAAAARHLGVVIRRGRALSAE
jgi:hypothetical protein